jgi:hypothetical protein
MNKTDYVNFLEIIFDLVGSQNSTEALNLIDGSKEELLKAYNDGYDAQKAAIPFDTNPFPEVKDTTYNSYIAWAEGWMNAYLETVNTDTGD